MTPVTPHGNATYAEEAFIDGCHIRINEYASQVPNQSWRSYTVSIGEARHYPFPNRHNLGLKGQLSATSSYKAHHDPTNICGSAIPGNELTGTKYRIGATAPMSSTVVPLNNLTDQYIQTPDIIRYLLDLVPQVTETTAAKGDLTAVSYEQWLTLEEGY